MPELRYRGIVFDLDGTLVDSYAALTDAINHARTVNGLPCLGDQAIRQLVGDGIEKLLERAFAPEVPAGAQQLFEERYDEVCCDQSRLLEDVGRTLEDLENCGVRMAVCTNKPTSFSRKILEHLGVARHFASIVGPDLAGARKPDARHVKCAQGSLGLPARETLFVGDMVVDVLAARNCGLDVAVIATGSSSQDELRAAEPDFLLCRFSDLVHLVREGRNGG